MTPQQRVARAKEAQQKMIELKEMLEPLATEPDDEESFLIDMLLDGINPHDYLATYIRRQQER